MYDGLHLHSSQRLIYRTYISSKFHTKRKYKIDLFRPQVDVYQDDFYALAAVAGMAGAGAAVAGVGAAAAAAGADAAGVALGAGFGS